MNEVLLTKTFQSADAVKTGLAMAGVSDVWTRLSAAITTGDTKQAIMARLNALAHRRNLIVHEGDLQRQMRPREVKRQALTHAEVQAELLWIRAFVDALSIVAP
jgi:hypothetical protein